MLKTQGDGFVCVCCDLFHFFPIEFGYWFGVDEAWVVREHDEWSNKSRTTDCERGDGERADVSICQTWTGLVDAFLSFFLSTLRETLPSALRPPTGPVCNPTSHNGLKLAVTFLQASTELAHARYLVPCNWDTGNLGCIVSRRHKLPGLYCSQNSFCAPDSGSLVCR